MKQFKLLTALVLGAVVMLHVMPSAVEANEQTQKQDQKLKVSCTTGSYGQTSTCTAEGEQHQEQTQRITYVDSISCEPGQKTVMIDGKLVHCVADTALDMYAFVAVAGILTTGAAAYVAKRKLA